MPIRTLVFSLFCASGLLVLATHAFWPSFWRGKEVYYLSSTIRGLTDGNREYFDYYRRYKNSLTNQTFNRSRLTEGRSSLKPQPVLDLNETTSIHLPLSSELSSNDAGTVASKSGEDAFINSSPGLNIASKAENVKGTRKSQQHNTSVYTTALVVINQTRTTPNDNGTDSPVNQDSTEYEQPKIATSSTKKVEEDSVKKKFNVSSEDRKKEPDPDFDRKQLYLYEHLVCVTAISDNHFRESHGLFKSVHRCLPDKKIIVYDLGLNFMQREQVRKLQNVELRSFPFDDYLPYMKDLYTYAWKPVVVKLVSEEYNVIMYGDSSLRMISCDLTSAFKHLLKFPLLNAHSLPYRAIEFTHDGMIEYLHYPKARIDMAAIQTLEAGGWLMWANSFLKKKVIDPWFDCAIHQECIAPDGAKLWPCRFTAKHDGHYVGCHRYDQSAMLLILAREFGLDFESKVSNTAISSRLWAIRKN